MSIHDLLNESTRWDAEYGDSHSNQLPATLAALHRLGAGDARLAEFTSHYTPRLHPAPAIEPWPAGDAWRSRFGDPWAWPVYRDFFRQWLAHEGMADVLHQTLPYLVQGCGGAAFHGMTRVASAVEAVAPDVLADGLAYWACRWTDLGPGRPEEAASERDPGRLLDALAALKGLTATRKSRVGPITHGMQEAARARGFDAVVARLRVDDGTLPRLARLAAQRYARSGDSAMLHLVTSAQALQTLMPFIDDATAAVAAYWRAYAAAVALAGDVSGRACALRDWPDLVEAAVASDDAHLVQLVDACRQAQTAHGGTPDWQRAASRAVAGMTRAAGGAEG